jgi:hypothetical protein
MKNHKESLSKSINKEINLARNTGFILGSLAVAEHIKIAGFPSSKDLDDFVKIWDKILGDTSLLEQTESLQVLGKAFEDLYDKLA